MRVRVSGFGVLEETAGGCDHRACDHEFSFGHLGGVEGSLEFLVKVGLCTSKDGKFAMAKKRTFITGDSPAYGRHLLNWRLKAIEQIQKNPHVPFAYTSPMIISQEDAHKVRDILQEAIRKIDALVEPSKSEKIFCLNIDWFKL